MLAAHKEALAKALAEAQTPTAEGSLRSRFDDGKLVGPEEEYNPVGAYSQRPDEAGTPCPMLDKAR
jgi:hypothetical protein